MTMFDDVIGLYVDSLAISSKVIAFYQETIYRLSYKIKHLNRIIGSTGCCLWSEGEGTQTVNRIG